MVAVVLVRKPLNVPKSHATEQPDEGYLPTVALSWRLAYFLESSCKYKRALIALQGITD